MAGANWNGQHWKPRDFSRAKVGHGHGRVTEHTWETRRGKLSGSQGRFQPPPGLVIWARPAGDGRKAAFVWVGDSGKQASDGGHPTEGRGLPALPHTSAFVELDAALCTQRRPDYGLGSRWPFCF